MTYESKPEIEAKQVSFTPTGSCILGNVVSEVGIKPDPARIEAIVNWFIPKNVHDIRAFVGVCSYYRHLDSQQL